MKRLLLFTAVVLFASSPLFGQKLVIGDKAPELKVTSWIDNTPQLDGKAVMVEFYHSSGKGCSERLSALSDLAGTMSGKINIVVVTREQTSDVYATLKANSPAYYPAYDEGGKMFSAYSVSYVPYAVIYDKKGRIVWLGNPSNLTADEIGKIL